MNNQELIRGINKLKKEKNAVILVHNYQVSEIYEVADFLGDSLELCQKAANTDAEIIVFCGVDFMAESAKVLSPDKIVLHPEKLAECPMAQMVSASQILEMKEKYPSAAVVSYVNTTTEVKAVSDICCTSANAVKVVGSLSEKEIIFAPDKNLAAYVQSKLPEKKIIPVEGHCYVHDKILASSVKEAKNNYPNASVVVHPECRPDVVSLGDVVCSTSQMISYCGESDAKEFIIATECGMINRLAREIPDKKFYAIGGVCIQMKKISLQKVYDSLKNEKVKIELSEEVRLKAKKALDRMLEVV
ncbi:MAG: quinolinate synthase NadA [Candidatus Woesearchaeota archaeon]|jgi:quinolinate synthase|nr:quinolinate synthase NadA [Candidatus Woesearchaeota archaeon]MDP7323854.1 quinolinate synthase NadA [Candidatus Woesearchaeota archaeon]